MTIFYRYKPSKGRSAWLKQTLFYLFWTAFAALALYGFTSAGYHYLATSPTLLQAAAPQQTSSVIPLEKVRTIAKALDAEVMENGPGSSQFDSAYANPCWKTPGGLRCLPSVLLAGNFHTGATALAQKIAKHPKLIMGSQDQFWAEDGKTMAAYIASLAQAAEAAQRDPEKLIMDGSQSTFAFYWAAAGKAHRAFANVVRPCYDKCAANSSRVDECMSTTCYPAAQAADRQVAAQHGVSYGDLHVPLLMRAVYGDKLPKMVVLIRNPIDRLHSAYYGYFHYYSKYGKTPDGFLQYVKEQTNAFAGCVSRNHTVAECVLYFEALGSIEEKVYFHCDQLFRGTYSVFLECWLKFFPRDNFLILKSEDYFKDEASVIKRIFSFLGLAEPDAAVWEAIKTVAAPNSYARDQAMLPEARDILRNFYKPFNEQLAGLLQDPTILMWNQ